MFDYIKKNTFMQEIKSYGLKLRKYFRVNYTPYLPLYFFSTGFGT